MIYFVVNIVMFIRHHKSWHGDGTMATYPAGCRDEAGRAAGMKIQTWRQ